VHLQASRQAGKIKNQKSLQALKVSRLFVDLKAPKISIMHWQHHHQNAVCRQIKFQSYSISSQQPPLSLTQPTSPSRKHPRCMSTGFANLNKKEAFPSDSKTPKMFANLYKKRSFPKCCRNTQDTCKSQFFFFFQVFQTDKAIPLYQSCTNNSEENSHSWVSDTLNLCEEGKGSQQFQQFQSGWRRKQFYLSIYLSIYLFIWGKGF
jgi:hypothetical protein